MSTAVSPRAVQPYAAALYEAAEAIGEHEQVGAALAELAKLWEQTPELKAFLTHPRVPTDAKESFLGEALGDTLHPYIVNTLRLMARRGRAALLPNLRDAFLRAAEERGSLVRAVLHTARTVAPEQLEMLRKQLQSATGRPVVLEVASAPELLAGAELEVAGRRLDASMQGRLARLAEELKG